MNFNDLLNNFKARTLTKQETALLDLQKQFDIYKEITNRRFAAMEDHMQSLSSRVKRHGLRASIIEKHHREIVEDLRNIHKNL